MEPPRALPGFLAADAEAVRRTVGDSPSVTVETCGSTVVAQWGSSGLEDGTLLLSPVVRTREGRVRSSDVADEMRVDPARLGRLLPPFAAVRRDDQGASMVADSMGFRPLYHSEPGGSTPPALSTSAILAGRAMAAELDQTAVAVQSQLGWQLGQRTLHAGVVKLAPRTVARIADGKLRLIAPTDAPEPSMTMADAVEAAAGLLQTSLDAVLDDHPDAVLQLTGGQDSRILLSAIPPSRRRGLRAMTLDVPGGGDVAVAAELAQRYGLRHEVHALASLDAVTPAEAWTLVRAAAARMDGTADPVAQAALGLAESDLAQGVRISGLGGEVARGFYYVGRVRDRPVTVKEARQLGAWRLFVNESVERDALDDDFRAWARDAADTALFEAISAGGTEWYRSTDDLYLRHRMQRWAGVTDVAEAGDRLVINPMLDEEFLTIAHRLAPADKADSRFLARLQMRLDPDLGRIRLEGRPAPAAYAQPGAWSSAVRGLSTGRRLAKKAVQRIRRGTRAPAGGEQLCALVIRHWRENGAILDDPVLRPFIRRRWVDDVLAGRVDPSTSSVAFVTSLLSAVEPSTSWFR